MVLHKAECPVIAGIQGIQAIAEVVYRGIPVIPVQVLAVIPVGQVHLYKAIVVLVDIAVFQGHQLAGFQVIPVGQVIPVQAYQVIPVIAVRVYQVGQVIQVNQFQGLAVFPVLADIAALQFQGLQVIRVIQVAE